MLSPSTTFGSSIMAPKCYPIPDVNFVVIIVLLCIFFTAWLLPTLVVGSQFDSNSIEYGAFSLVAHALVLWMVLTFQYVPKVSQMRPVQQSMQQMMLNPSMAHVQVPTCTMSGYVIVQDNETSPGSRLCIYFALVALLLYCTQIAMRNANPSTRKMLQWACWGIEIIAAYAIISNLYDPQAVAAQSAAATSATSAQAMPMGGGMPMGMNYMGGMGGGYGSYGMMGGGGYGMMGYPGNMYGGRGMY